MWLLQEQMNLTNILDYNSENTPLDVFNRYRIDRGATTFYHLQSNTRIITRTNLPSIFTFRLRQSKLRNITHQSGSGRHTRQNSIYTQILFSIKHYWDIYEIILLSVYTDSVQWLDPRWNATLITLEIKFNGVTSDVNILVLHCSHTDAAKLFAQTKPTAIILNGLTETSGPHPYRKDASIVESVTNLNPKFVAIDTPEFINDKAHTAGVVEWYTVENGEWDTRIRVRL